MSSSSASITVPTGFIAAGSQNVTCRVDRGSWDDWVQGYCYYRINGGTWTLLPGGSTIYFLSATDPTTYDSSVATLTGLVAGDIVDIKIDWEYYDGAMHYPSDVTASFTVSPAPTAPTTNTSDPDYQDLTPTAKWSGATGYIDTYDISYTTNGSTPDDTADSTGLTSAEYDFGAVAAGTAVKFKVRSVNLNGTSAWSSVWTINCADTPEAPILDSPADAAVDQAVKPTLTWHDNAVIPDGSGLSSYSDSVAHYKLNDNAASSAVADASGNSRNATLYNGGSTANTNAVDDAVNYKCDESDTASFVFDNDAASHHVRCPSSVASALGSGSRTFACWIRLADTPAAAEGIISDNASTGHNRINVRVSTSRQLILDGQGMSAITGPTILAAETWYLIFVTYNSTTKAVKLYINGVLESSGTLATYYPASADVIAFGCDIDPGPAYDQFFDGNLDNILIYDKELSDTEAAQLLSSTGKSATSYKVYLDKAGASTFIQSQAGTSYTPAANLDYSTTYYWTIVAVNAAGESAPATVRSFTTVAVTAGAPIQSSGFTKKLCALAGDGFYYEDDNAQMRRLHGLALDTSTSIMMCPAYNSIFIVNGSTKKVVDFASAKLTLDGIPSGADKPYNGDIITGVTTGAQMSVTHWPGGVDVYGVMLTTDHFQAGEALLLNNDAMTATLNPTAAEATGDPYWFYTWQEDEPAINDNMPIQADVVLLYGGRLVLMDRNVYYMSRIGNPFDFLYAADDVNSPVAGVQDQVGKIGDMLIGGIPFRDDYLVIGCSTSLWVIKGNLMSGGRQQLLSSSANMFSATSWCYGENGSAYVLGTTSIFRISANLDVENLSMEAIPNIVADLGLNQNDHRVTLGYDKRRHGISIKIVTIETGETTGYWYDLRTNGFFPEDMDDSIAPMSQFFYDAANDSFRKMLVGGQDGIIRYHDDSQKSDEAGWIYSSDEAAITSHVLLGPVQITDSRQINRILNRLSFILAGGDTGGILADTDSITYELYIAKTAEQVIEKANAGNYFLTGTISGPGRYRDIRTRARGVFAAIKIKNELIDETWSLEEVMGEAIQAGRVQHG